MVPKAPVKEAGEGGELRARKFTGRCGNAIDSHLLTRSQLGGTLQRKNRVQPGVPSRGWQRIIFVGPLILSAFPCSRKRLERRLTSSWSRATVEKIRKNRVDRCMKRSGPFCNRSGVLIEELHRRARLSVEDFDTCIQFLGENPVLKP